MNDAVYQMLREAIESGVPERIEAAKQHVSTLERDEARKAMMYQVDALIDAGWKFVLPEQRDSDPYQWSWRAPAKRGRKLGKLWQSTNQAYMALQRSLPPKP